MAMAIVIAAAIPCSKHHNHRDASLYEQNPATVVASGDNKANEHIFKTINLGNGDATAAATASPGATHSWEHRPNGNSVAAQCQQVFTTMAIASWQFVNF